MEIKNIAKYLPLAGHSSSSKGVNNIHESFDCDVSFNRDELLICLSGDLDAYSVPIIQNIIDSKYSPLIRSISIDCDAVQYVDSAFLQMLIQLNSRTSHIQIRNASKTIRKIFEITGLRDTFIAKDAEDF